MRNLLLAAAAVIAMPSIAQAQDLTGKRVGVQYLYPTASSIYADAVNTVGTDGATSTAGGIFSIGFTGTTATAGTFAYSTNWSPAAFNGFRLYDIDGTIDDFAVTLGASNMAGLTAANITGDANNVYVNWQGLSFTRDTSVTLDFAAGVPEPATWAFMIMGFGMVGGSFRARKATLRFA